MQIHILWVFFFLKDYVEFLNQVDFEMWKITMNYQNLQRSLVHIKYVQSMFSSISFQQYC